MKNPAPDQHAAVRTGHAPGKIILSGEYAMGLIGARGITIPSSLGIRVIFEENAALEGLEVDWQEIDDLWKHYLNRILRLSAESCGDAFRGRLWIRNELPLGKGMGSSTALVIAVCRALLGEDCEKVALRIEDIVNPGHSGMDFAVIWTNAPIVFRKGEPSVPLEKDMALPNAVLIDTGTPHETTAELVEWLKNRMGEQKIQDALTAIGQCTDRLLQGESPLTVFPDHHQTQVALGVVPAATQELIVQIEQAGGAAKVIGAGARTGGGGMVLAIHPHENGLDGVTPSVLTVMQLRTDVPR